MARRVVVIGGGLAGLTAGVELCSRDGYEVTLLERAPRAGGQCAAYRDAEGDPIEVGIHLLFPWYDNMLALYERVGAPLPLCPTDGNYYVMNPQTRGISVLRTSPDAMEMIRGLFAYPDLGFRDKVQFLRMVLGAFSLPPELAERFDGATVKGYLGAHRVGPRLLDFCENGTVTIQGLYADEASAASFLKFIRLLFGSESKLHTSFFRKPTDEALVAPLTDFITKQRGKILFGTSVERIERSGDHLRVVAPTGSFEADAVIAAIAPSSLLRLLPPDVRERMRGLSRLKSATVLTVELHFDRKVFPDENIYISNRRGVMFDAVCDKACHWDRLKGEGHGSVVQVLLDAGYEGEFLSDEQLRDLVLADLKIYFPRSRDARMTKCIVQRLSGIYNETRPGYWSAVPRQHRTPLPGLYLAGDWTDGPYHYGMESAVVSGIQAVNDIGERDRQPRRAILQPALPSFFRYLRPFGALSARLHGYRDG